MFCAWINEKIKKLTCTDLAVTKLCVMAFTLMVAKLWSPILSLPWYWYGLVFAVTYIYLIKKLFGGCCGCGASHKT